MRFHLFYVTGRGYKRAETFDVATVADACARHVTAYRCKRTAFALAMRGPDAKRYCFNDSAALRSRLDGADGALVQPSTGEKT